MRKIQTILTAITLISFSFSSQAQDKNGRISGTILDYSGKQVEAASVSLLKAKDSSLVKIGAADKQGQFSFESLPEGNYLVAASAVGFGKKFSEVLEISSSKKEVTLKSLWIPNQQL